MAEIIEQKTVGTTTTKWWSPYMTPQTMFWILAAFVYGVIFWKDSHDNWDKTNKLEEIVNTKADGEDLKTLKDQVNRQYSNAKEDKEKEMKAIEEVADWMHYQIGYQQALKDYGIKAK